MKLYFFAFLFVFNFSYSSKLEGYYITTDNEKINTFFNIPVDAVAQEIYFQELVFGVKYYDENDKKQKLNLKNVKEIGFYYLGKKTILKCLANTGNLGTNHIGDTSYVLLLPIKEDIISIYYYPKSSYSPGFMSGSSNNMGSFQSDDSTVLVKSDGKMVEPHSLGSFKNKMKDFFSDCPELVKKIDGKIYKAKHLQEIIADYQKNCAPSTILEEKE